MTSGQRCRSWLPTRSLRRRIRRSLQPFEPSTRRPPTTNCFRRRSRTRTRPRSPPLRPTWRRPSTACGRGSVARSGRRPSPAPATADLKGSRRERPPPNTESHTPHQFVTSRSGTECAREALFGASLCAMRKGDGGLIPIAIGSIYRRLACRIAARHVATTVGEELRPVQLRVGTPQGCEAAVHATREYLAVAAAAGSPHLLVKMDVRNAFNTVRRDGLLSQVKARAPLCTPCSGIPTASPPSSALAARLSPPAAACSRATHSARRRSRCPRSPSSEP